MKSFVFLTSMLVIAAAQRPGYLGNGPVGYPGLASRFKDDSTTASASASSASTPNVNNRLGETDGTTPKIPIDARGDVALINRVNNWPREHRPFWVLNAEHIEAQRNTQTQQQQGPNLSQRYGEDDQGFQPDYSIQNGVYYDNFGNPIQAQPIRPVQSRGSFAGSV